MYKNILLNLIAFLSFSVLLTACGGGGGESDNAPDRSRSFFTLSGDLFVDSNTREDSDTNDVNSETVSNDTLDTAQVIPNPTTLGGYVNVDGEGEIGASGRFGDPDDLFRVQLFAGQTVTLLIAADNLKNTDLDLGLLDGRTGDLLDASLNLGNTESLNIIQDGEYVIQVQAFSGASNYVLLIGQNTRLSSQHTDRLRLSDDFISGEITAQFKQFGSLQTQAISSLGLTTLGGSVDRRQLFSINSQQSLSSLSQSQRIQPHFKNLKTAKKYATLLAVKQLRRRDDVLHASPNYRLNSLLIPNDRLYNLQWHYDLINLPQAWNITQGSRDVIVAVIDTGVLLSHPDLQNKLVAGYDFVRDPSIALDGNGIDDNPDDPGDQSASGSSFHGTHVAGTIAANSNNGEGTAGVAWFTRIMPLRILGRNGSGDDFSLEQAIRFAAGLANDSGRLPTQVADIINLSLGGPSISPAIQNVINAARDAGVIIVAAAGNDGNSTITFPAALDGVISVAAVDINKNHADYSNTNRTVDVAAPGGSSAADVNGDGIPDGILSSSGDDSNGRIEFTYASAVGTSMATPHMAGVISLMKAVNPNLNGDDIEALLRSGQITDDLGTIGRDNLFGFGLINAQKAVIAATNLLGNILPEPAPLLNISPAALNFGSILSQQTLNLSNAGGGDLRILAVQSNDTALTIQNHSASTGIINISLNRNFLNDGVYQSSIQVSSNVNTIEIPVIWQVGSNGSGDAGTQYVIAVDIFSDEVIASAEILEADNGVYHFDILDVPEGDYFLFSGSDADNDGFICGVGESCGAYLTLDRPIELLVDRSMDRLQFDLSYDTQFSSLGLGQSVVLRGRNKGRGWKIR